MRKLFLIFCLLTTVLLGSYSTLVAQSNDCGNGLTPQLSISARGWVIPEPPLALNVRTVPGGNLVDQIEPGEMFTVLDGPQCEQTFTWWQIESDDGLIGWVAEGTDRYYIEPLPMGGGVGGEIELNDNLSIVISDTSCSGDPTFSVGDSVAIIDPNATAYYGHPLIEQAFFSIVVMESYYEEGRGQMRGEAPFFGVQDRDWTQFTADGAFVIDGPYCVNNEYAYKIGGTGNIIVNSDRIAYYIGSSRPLWFTQDALVSEPSIQLVPEFDVPTFDLQADAAPVIDVQSQISYGSQGGGSRFVAYWLPDECALGDMYTSIGAENMLQIRSLPFVFPIDLCMSIYPIPSSPVTVRIYRPDGTLHTEFDDTTREIGINRDLNDGTVDRISTEGIMVNVPGEFGLMSGIWQIEVDTGTETIRRAYHYVNDDVQRIQAYCEGAYRRFLLNGFEPMQDLNIVHVSIDRDEMDSNNVLELPLAQNRNWEVQTDETGRLLLNMRFLPEQFGYLVVTPPDGDWRDQLEGVNNAFPGTSATLIMRMCATDDEAVVVAPGRLATGIGDFILNASGGDMLNLEARIFPTDAFASSNEPVTISVVGPDGTVLTSMTSDSAIDLTDVLLPVDGQYMVNVSTEQPIANSFGFFSQTIGFIVDLERSTLLETYTLDDFPLSGDLATQSNWVIEATAGEMLTIEIDAVDFDPILTIFDENSDEVASDDDSGVGLNSRIEFTVPEDGEYTIAVSAWNDKSGEYTLEVVR